MRSKSAIYNTIAELSLQIVTIISGFLIPRLILINFGSEVNGIVSSVTQFLGYIVLLEAGAGGVVKAALYKPLVDHDNNRISGIIISSEKFFKRVAYILLVYILILVICYPLIIREFSFFYTALLIFIIGSGTVAQYYFGISYQLLLGADQKSYIVSCSQILAITVNTFVVVLIANLGAGIHLIKLVTAIVFTMRPIILYWYTRQKYDINKKLPFDNQSIRQQWDGLATHIAFFIHRNTDIAVLTIFKSLKDVSVYSVYSYVIVALGRIIESISAGISAAFGNMLANNEKNALCRAFDIYELFNNFSTTILFTSCGILIVPFVKLYTQGVQDANYIQPVFAYLYVASEAIYAVRAPFETLVYAAGHYRQTRGAAFREAAINIVLSIVFINIWGIVGVSIGTLISMAYRTVSFAFYISKNILFRSMYIFARRIFVSLLSSAVIIFLVTRLPLSITSYFSWLAYAFLTVFISSIISFLLCMIFERQSLLITMLKIKNILLIKRKN